MLLSIQYTELIHSLFLGSLALAAFGAFLTRPWIPAFSLVTPLPIHPTPTRRRKEHRPTLRVEHRLSNPWRSPGVSSGGLLLVEVDLHLLMDGVLASVRPHLRSAHTSLSQSRGGHLGLVQTNPATLRETLGYLFRFIASSGKAENLHLAAERFQDDVTRRDWVEISVETTCPIPWEATAPIRARVDRLDGKFDLETDSQGSALRVYLPCQRIIPCVTMDNVFR
ncbi:MAG: hypothetical protein AAF191_11675 [Verrucomicrobiota bacterium]